MTFCIELEQIILKFTQNHKRPRIAKAILKKKNKSGGITIPDFRQYYNELLSSNRRVLAQKKRPNESVEQNREPRNKHYSQLIYNKVGKNIQWRRQSLQQEVLGKLDSYMKKNKIEHSHSVTYTKINSNELKT